MSDAHDTTYGGCCEHHDSTAAELRRQGRVTAGVNLRTDEPVKHDPLAVVVEEAWTMAPAPATERAVDELARQARRDVH